MSFSGTFCIEYFGFYSSTVYKEISFFNILEFWPSDHLDKFSAHRVLEPDVYQAVYNFNEDGCLHNIGTLGVLPCLLPVLLFMVSVPE